MTSFFYTLIDRRNSSVEKLVKSTRFQNRNRKYALHLSMALEPALWPANQKRTVFLNFHHSHRQLGKLNVRGEDEGATILQDEGVEASGLCGGFQLLDLTITELKSHMTC